MTEITEDIYTEAEADVDTLAQVQPFRHTDRNTLRKIGEPTPIPPQ